MHASASAGNQPARPSAARTGTAAVPDGAPAWHTLEVAEVLSLLGGDPTRGLGRAEATRRLASVGPNELEAAHHVSPWAVLLDQFKNVLVVILLVAVGLSAFLGHGIEAIAIAVIVLFAVLLGFVQEYRAERAIEALREMAAPIAAVVRDGEEVDIPAREIVPGDLILLRAGDKVPADGRIVEAINLQAEEAALTGESFPVEKYTAPQADAALALGDRRNLVYAGTAVTYGRGRAVVVATGMTSEFGKIARLLTTVESPRTPLQDNLDKVGHTFARGALAVVVVIVALGLYREQPFLEMLIFGIALAVAVVPEALPAVVTISLAIGVQRMAKRYALIRRLSAVETLGSTSVICSDKTGTLTKDEMTVRKVFVGGCILEVSGSGYEPRGAFVRDGSPIEPPAPLVMLLRTGVLASDAHLIRGKEHDRASLSTGTGWLVRGDPTEGALVVAAAKAGLDKLELDGQFPRANEIPFTSERKRMTTLHSTPDGVVACSKGAPEIILSSCAQQLTASGTVRLDTATRDEILAHAREMASAALRVLAVAHKPNATLENAESDMTFLGLVGMIDPPRPEAKAAIETCELAGITVVMITGDHPLTAQAVARELGILRHGRVVTGTDLEAMSDAELEREVRDIDVYARVSPSHKLRVVMALQENGKRVAMTGDGVNDAPALKKADVGVAMGITGTGVAKEAAAMTLTDDNFASIVAAVEEGRHVFANIKKYLMYLLSSNIGEIGLMASAVLAGLPLPLSAVQILYVNLATDGFPALALAVDPPEPDLMRRPPRSPSTGIFTRPIVILMLAGGLWSAAVNLGVFVWALDTGRSLPEAMTMTFVSLVLIQFFKAYNYRSDRQSVMLRPFANRWLNLAVAWELVLLAAIIYVPFLQKPFATYPLPLVDWVIVIALAFSVLPVLEVVKWMVRCGWFRQDDEDGAAAT
jgi:Ca2+-transporting ATPase